MFDLEKAIGAWRASLVHNHAFQPDDVAELEEHLREHVEHQVQEGSSREDAFNAAIQRLGPIPEMESEYRKVQWVKPKRRDNLTRKLGYEVTLIRNHLKAAGRLMRRHKSYTAINVGGLALGIACCLLILMFVRNELSYDRYHKNADRIYQVVLEADVFREQKFMNGMAAGFAPAVLNGRPEVERAFRMFPMGQSLLSSGMLKDYEELFYADASLFDVFSFTLLQGDPKTALKEPFSIVLNETLARKYFGEEQAVGKDLLTTEGQSYRVTGVMADVPAQSHWRPKGLVSFETLRSIGRPSLDALDDWFGYRTYLLLKPDADVKGLEAELPGFIATLSSGTPGKTRYHLQPLPDLYLHALAKGGGLFSGNPQVLYVFSGAALLILLIACVNYMNLATARSSQRAREVGVRKTVGAQRGQLIRQHLTESVGLGLVAAMLGLMLAVACLPLFNRLSGLEIGRSSFADPVLGAGVIGLGILVGLLSGSYPALLLSGVRPVLVLKGQTLIGSGSLLRKGLVTFQFVVTVALIASTLLMQRQLRFAREVNQGLQPDQIIAITMSKDSPVRRQFASVEAELARQPGVLQTAAASGYPTNLQWQSYGVEVEGVPLDDAHRRMVAPMEVDLRFVQTLGARVVEGRDFSAALDAARARDTVDVPFIVNQAFARAYGLQEPVGTGVKLEEVRGRIVGVVEDFFVGSVREEIVPLLLQPVREEAGFMLVRFEPRFATQVIRTLEHVWKKVDPESPLNYAFLDDRFAMIYSREQRLAGIFTTFSVLAIFVACLGLFGMATYTAERRTKEIGVRKVMGAGTAGLVLLLSRSFLYYVLAGFVIATPLAFFGMNRWLQAFAYHIRPNAGTFLFAGGVALLIALLTVSHQAIRAARINPSDALRHE